MYFSFVSLNNHKGEVYTFWNPVTRCSVHCSSAVFLQKKYQLTKSEIAKLIAGIDDPDKETYDEDEDIIPEDAEGNQIVHQYNAEISIAVSTTPTAMDKEIETTEEYDVPVAIQHKFAGVPREIRNLQALFNTDPGADWENLQGEADFMMLENYGAHETALIATMYDGSPEPKAYYEATQRHDFPNWLGDIWKEFKNIEQKVV
jgi:hypothetical protein